MNRNPSDEWVRQTWSKLERRLAHKKRYTIKFSAKEWEHLVSLSFEPFEFEMREMLTRGQWLALADMCLGKAYRFQRRAVEARGSSINPVWGVTPDAVLINDLRTIARKILQKFPDHEERPKTV